MAYPYDQALRHRMGDQLHQWLQDNFLLKDQAGAWMRAIFEEATPV